MCVSIYFPTCQVRVVRFYVSCLASFLPSFLLFLLLLLLLLLLVCNHDHLRPVFTTGPQQWPSTSSVHDHLRSVPCRTSTTATTTIHAQCSLPDLNRDHHTVFPAGPPPWASMPTSMPNTDMHMLVHSSYTGLVMALVWSWHRFSWAHTSRNIL